MKILIAILGSITILILLFVLYMSLTQDTRL